MWLADTNVLVNAHRRDAQRHKEYRDWVQAMVRGPEPYAVADFSVTGMVRIVTNPRIYREPATIDEALGFADQVRSQPHAKVVQPGPRFWPIFSELCARV